MADRKLLVVLLVDDEPLVRRMVARAVRRHYDVVEVESAEAALALIDSGQFFDAILCDLHLPGMSGLELHGRLHVRAPAQAARFILMSGTSDPSERATVAGQLADRFVQKPFQADELVALVKRIATRVE